MRPVCLIIRDGWGYSDISEGNAVLAARTPNNDLYRARYPWTILDCAGEPVGLPDGYQGSSEVGHLNMGAGRIVTQELKRIDDGLSSGELFNGRIWKKLVTHWRKHRSRLHLLGLLQDEGVHAHQEHLFKIMRRARAEYPDGPIIIHPFLDGRDTPPRSCLEYLATLTRVMEAVGGCTIGTVMGRYYGMDRSRNWQLTDMAYHCIVACEGRRAADAETAVKKSYAEERTPDGVEMCDEYILPHVIGQYDGVRDNDCVLHTNYRQDRAIQLSMAFVDPEYPGNLRTKPAVTYVGLTRYWDEFTEYMLGAIDAGGGMKNLLGEVISESGLRQLRIAETQKFRHVTSFFNGKMTTPYKNEDQVDVPSRFDPADLRQPSGDGGPPGDRRTPEASRRQPLSFHRREFREWRYGGAHGRHGRCRSGHRDRGRMSGQDCRSPARTRCAYPHHGGSREFRADDRLSDRRDQDQP